MLLKETHWCGEMFMIDLVGEEKESKNGTEIDFFFLKCVFIDTQNKVLKEIQKMLTKGLSGYWDQK